MTCIVACKDSKNPSKIWMGADSLGGNYHSFSVRKDKKIFKIKNMLIGYTTSYRMGQILQFQTEIPEDTYSNPYVYMVKSFVPAILESFKDHQYLIDENGQKKGGEFIVVYKERIFIIHNDFQVAEHAIDFCSVGSGSEVAWGAMFASSNNKNTSERILQALRAASNKVTTVCPPFIIKNNLDSRTKTFKK